MPTSPRRATRSASVLDLQHFDHLDGKRVPDAERDLDRLENSLFLRLNASVGEDEIRSQRKGCFAQLSRQCARRFRDQRLVAMLAESPISLVIIALYALAGWLLKSLIRFEMAMRPSLSSSEMWPSADGIGNGIGLATAKSGHAAHRARSCGDKARSAGSCPGAQARPSC